LPLGRSSSFGYGAPKPAAKLSHIAHYSHQACRLCQTLFEHTSSSTPKSGLVCFVELGIDDHGSLNGLNDAAALLLVRGADFLSVFEKPQREVVAAGIL
jgi:hypothetical protein